MASDIETLLAQIDRYRTKAAELRERAARFSGASVAADFKRIAQDYDDMAAQLDAIVRDYRR